MKIRCSTPTCTNYQVIERDREVPTHWLCSDCLDHLDQQMLEDLERRERERNQPIPQERF